jgi:dienelactone hydrolase
VKAASGRRAAARRGVAAAICASALAACACGESAPASRTGRSVAATASDAHPASAPAASDKPASAPAPAAWHGPHPVASRALTVAGDGLYGRWYTPTDLHRSRPGVVAFGGSNGGLHTGPLARAFASYGYPALALAYFKAPGLPSRLDDVPLEYFERAIRFARHRPGVDRVVVSGSSRGGEAALLLGATYPALVRGVVAIVPHYQTNYGWSLDGKSVPYDQVIPVERIHGPILTASGGRDRIWSSSVYTGQIELRLRDQHFRFPHERLDFPHEGHSLAGAQAELWTRIRTFMRRLAATPPDPARGS